MKIKIGDLVEDSHYGVGTVEDVGYEGWRCRWVRAHFPKMAHLNSGGRVQLSGNLQLRALKVISRACEKSENNLNISE